VSSLGDLIVKVGADIAGFTQAMGIVTAGAREGAERVQESMGEMEESVAQFAESTRLAGAEVANVFGGLAAVMGGGALLGIMGEVLEKTREQVTEFSHLSEATGVSIEHIAELKATFQDFGNSGENMEKVLAKLSRSIVQASQGHKEQIQALNALGIATKSWGAELPKADVVLLQISDHMAKSTDTTRDLGNASLVLGRDVVGLVGVLKQGKEALQDHMKANQDFGRAMEEAAPSAKQLTALSAQLGHAWQGLAATVLPVATGAVKALASALYVVQAGLKNVIDSVWAVTKAVNDGLWGVINHFIRLAHGDLKGAQLALGEAGVKMTSDMAEGGQKMSNAWGKAAESIKALWQAVKEGKEGSGADVVDEVGGKVAKEKVPKPPKDDYEHISQLLEKINRQSGELFTWQVRWGTELKKDGDAMEQEALKPLQIQIPLWLRMSTAVREAYLNVLAVNQAYKDMGITSTASLQEQAAHAAAAYDLIKNSGIASAHDILAAHIAMLEARMAAELAAGEKISAIEEKELSYLKYAMAHLGQVTPKNDLFASFQKSFEMIGSSFKSTIDRMLEGTLRFKQAWGVLGQDLLRSYTADLVHMGTQWLGFLAKKLALHLITNAAIVNNDEAASAQQSAISLATHLKEVLKAAKLAAVRTYAAVSSLPFPVGVILAPIAAAGAFAGVMALGAVSAERGALLPNHNTIGLLHPKEMVLPRGISEGLQGMIAAGAGGGGHTFNLTQHISSTHGQSAAEIAKIAIAGARKHFRNNHGRL